MKQCPVCNQTYTDENLNFCLNDGELLRVLSAGPESRPFVDDSPPTVMFDQSRVTNPTGWQSPPAVWQGQNQSVQQAPFGQYAMPLPPNQTLAVVSLCLGISSITIGWCCSLGVLLSPAALITGFIALSQIKKDPRSYGGRGLAIGGLVTGSIYIAAFVLLLILYGAAFFFSLIGR